jgi:hypothetical protein
MIIFSAARGLLLDGQPRLLAINSPLCTNLSLFVASPRRLYSILLIFMNLAESLSHHLMA